MEGVMKIFTALKLSQTSGKDHWLRFNLRAKELVALLQQVNSEWIGVTLDFGNNVALMEDPMEVVETLLPYLFSTHVKDMGVDEYADGILLSEVPLGEGIVDLPKVFSLCTQQNPNVTFNLEMITRDPLEIPCLKNDYWSTLKDASAIDLAQTLQMVKTKKFKSALPRVSQLTTDERLAAEEKNIITSIAYSKTLLEH